MIIIVDQALEWLHINNCGYKARLCATVQYYEYVQVSEDGTEKRVRCVRHGGAFKRHSSQNSNGGFTNKRK